MSAVLPARAGTARPPVRPADRATRPLEVSDLPQVVALRAQAFHHAVHRSPEEMAAYFARLFLDGPWRDPDLPSLVHLDADGRVCAFLGVLVRRMRFRGRTLRMAVPTQLMARPDAPAGAGVRLARSIFEGPQDLTFSDVANDMARRVWVRLGGAVSATHSLFWTLPLRPLRHAVARLGASPAARAAGWILRPACALGDRLLAPEARPKDHLVPEPLDAARHLPAITALLARWPLHPIYEADGLAQQLAELGTRIQDGPLTGALLRDGQGDEVGWYLFHANRGGTGEVIQIGAAPGGEAPVFAHLVERARTDGVVALRGRLDPALLVALRDYAPVFHRDGPWTLSFSRDPDLLATALGGGAFLSRLEGEAWLNF